MGEEKFPFISVNDLTRPLGPKLAADLVYLYRGEDLSMKRVISAIYFKIKSDNFSESDAYEVESSFYDRGLTNSRFYRDCKDNRFSRTCL